MSFRTAPLPAHLVEFEIREKLGLIKLAVENILIDYHMKDFPPEGARSYEEASTHALTVKPSRYSHLRA